MKLKHVAFTILTSVILGTCLFSCDNKDETMAPPLPYTDVQIHSLAIHFTQNVAETKTDSIIYKELEDKYGKDAKGNIAGYNKFVIDQARGLIFNDDSLPYQTRLTTFPATFGFGAYVSPAITVITADSTYLLETRDSLDLRATNLKISIGAANVGNLKEKTYTLDIRVHQIDPDTIIWKRLKSHKDVAKKQTTIVWGNKYVNYQLREDNKVYATSFNPISEDWETVETTNLPANVNLNSITSFDNKVFAVANDGFGYVSSDAISWTKGNNFNLQNILGVVPGSTEDKDIMLSLFKKDDKHCFVTTKDMVNFEEVAVDGNPDTDKSLVPYNFVSSGFASSIIKDNDTNVLALVAGTDVLGRKTNITWVLRLKDNKTLQVTTTDQANHKLFDPQEGLAGMYYDKNMYILNDSIFTTSNNLGGQWTLASAKQSIPEEMKNEKYQSISVDNKNNIWVFSGMPNTKTSVWRGRLNKLNPKR